MPKTYGLILAPRDHGFRPDETQPDHYVYQGVSGIEDRPVLNSTGDWTPYLPKAERQNSAEHFYDTRNCVVFANQAALETLRNFHKFDDFPSDCSDRFIGVMAGSEGNGNTPHKVLEAIRASGVIPDHVLPFTESIRSNEEYFSPRPMSPEFVKLGQENRSRFNVFHEWVFNNDQPPARKQELLLEALTKGAVTVSVYAWDKDKKTGLYTKPKGADDGHMVLLVSAKPGKSWRVLDQYDAKGGNGRTFFKDLAWDHNFDCAKVVYLSRVTPEQDAAKRNILTKLIETLRQLIQSAGKSLSGLWTQ